MKRRDRRLAKSRNLKSLNVRRNYRIAEMHVAAYFLPPINRSFGVRTPLDPRTQPLNIISSRNHGEIRNFVRRKRVNIRQWNRLTSCRRFPFIWIVIIMYDGGQPCMLKLTIPRDFFWVVLKTAVVAWSCYDYLSWSVALSAWPSVLLWRVMRLLEFNSHGDASFCFLCRSMLNQCSQCLITVNSEDIAVDF